MREESLFLAALDIPDPARRRAYLDDACDGDAPLRERVERLLAADGDGGLLARSAGAAGPGDPWADPTLAAGQDFAGRFRLVRKLGEGGMGEVWVADQARPVRRAVALKVVRPGVGSAGLLARFEAERQALALMDHPHIAKVLDAGVADGRPFIVMELIAGEPITAYCDARRLTTRDRLRLLADVCRAVQHAHQKGVIHRDLKPSNVLVTEVDGRPAPKVIDFGVAKATGRKLADDTLHTGVGTVVGTLEYMAPEQAAFDARDVDTRADVYALGVLLYELLAGSPPVRRADAPAADVLETIRQIRDVDPPRPSARLAAAPDLPALAAARGTEPGRLVRAVRGELDWVAMKCLAKDRAGRYESASALAADIGRHLAGGVVEARPPTAAYRLRKFARRHAVALGTAAAVGLLVTAAGAVSAWQAVRARAAERRAVADRDAVLAARRAEAEEAAVTRAVQGFLQDDLLGQADLRNQDLAGGRDPRVTVRELLDRAAARIGDRFRDRPRTEAAIRLTIGTAYRGLGEFPEAARHLERALALREATAGAEHRETLAAATALGELYHAQGRYPEADALLARTLEAYDRADAGAEDDALVTALNLAKVHAARGRFDQAEELYARGLEGFRGRYGDRHPSTLLAMSGLGKLYRARGRPDRAAPVLTRVMDLAGEVLGPDHPGTLAVTVDVARLHRDAGRLDAAEELAVRVLDLSRSRQGADHPDTHGAALHLAQVYNATGRPDRAEPLLRQALDGLRARFGDGDDRTLTAMNSLAAAHLGRGRPADAVPLFRRVADAWRERHGPGHPRSLVALNNLAAACDRAGRAAEAAATYEEMARGLDRRGFEVKGADAMVAAATDLWDRAVRAETADAYRRKWAAAVGRKAGPQSPAYTAALAELGEGLLRQRKWAAAEVVLRECLAIREGAEPDGWPTFAAKALLGAALLGRGQYADAEPLLRAGYDGLKAREGAVPSADRRRLRAAANWLAALSAAVGDDLAAARWRAERGQYPPPVERAPAPRPVG